MAVADPGATMKYVMRAHLFEENSANKTARPLTLFKSLLRIFVGNISSELSQETFDRKLRTIFFSMKIII